MKFRPSARLFNFSFLFSIIFLQTVFAQNPAGKNLYAYSTGGETNKTAVPIRPRVFVGAGKDAADKPKANFDRKAVNIFDVERRVFDLINKKRAEVGLFALVWNEDIARAARLHSANMAANDFFSHTGLDGKMVDDRADDAGVKHWRKIGENIAYNRGYGDPTDCAVEKWMLSPGHRDNILKSDWKESAVGVAVTEKGTFYFTQIFLLKK